MLLAQKYRPKGDGSPSAARPIHPITEGSCPPAWSPPIPARTDADDLPAQVKKSFDAIALVGSLADPIFAAFAGLNYLGIVLVMGGAHGA